MERTQSWRDVVSQGVAKRLVAAAAAALAALLAAGLAPTTAFAAPTDTFERDGAAVSSNVGKHEYYQYSGNWSQPITSYLHETADGVERVEWVKTDIGYILAVEEYEGAAPDYTLVSARTVSSGTYAPAGAMGASSLIWGGFYAGSSYNFVVVGQKNLSESPNIAEIRVTKYDKDWNFLGKLDLYETNTTTPFDAGSLDMVEVGGRLYVKTCHEMYMNEKGEIHQASMAFVVDEASMQLVDDEWIVYNFDDSRYGYASHSFNQRLAVLDGTVWSADHGDAYPRSIVLKKFGQRGGREALTFWGTYEQAGNYTGGALGGLEASNAADTILVAYSTVANFSLVQDEYDLNTVPRGAYLASIEASGNSRSIVNVAGDGTTPNGNPMLVKVSDDRFLVLWENLSAPGASSAGSLSYAFFDARATLLGERHTASGSLSDCEPVVVDGKAVWYVTGEDGADSAPVFYAVDVSTGELTTSDGQGGQGGEEGEGGEGEAVDLSQAAVTGIALSYEYSGGALKPLPTVSVDGRALTYGVDYTVTWRDNVDVGTATVTIAGQGSVTGRIERTFSVTPANIARADVFLETSYPYEGAPVRPDPVVAFNGSMLFEGDDYTVGYRNNNAAGTGQVILYGTGNFTGTAYVDFAIVASDEPDEPVDVPAFTDVAEGYWGAGHIADAVRMGFMSGDRTATGLAGTFRPEDNITRGEMITILYRHANPDSAATSNPSAYESLEEDFIKDVPDRAFYTAAINWAFEERIMQGDRDPETDALTGYLRPNDNISRQEVATTLERYAKWAGLDTSGTTDDYLGAPDADSVGGFAKEGIAWCFDNGVMTGDKITDELMPLAFATRAQMAKMVVAVANLVDA